MKISVTPSLFDRIPGLCIGVVAVRTADNAAVNMEAEAFRPAAAARKPIYC